MNLFLFDVRENLVASRGDGRADARRDRRRDRASAAADPLRPLLHRSAVWGCPVEVEHQILSAAIALPRRLRRAARPTCSGTMPRRTAASSRPCAGMKRGMLPMFGGEMKIQLDLTVTVPLVRPRWPWPARRCGSTRGSGSTAAAPEEIAEVAHERRPGCPRRAVADPDPFAPTRAALAAAVEAMPPPKPAAAARTARQGRPAHPVSGHRAHPGRARPVSGRPAQRRSAPAARRAAPHPARLLRRGQRPPGRRRPPQPPLAALQMAARGQAAQAQAALAQAVSALAGMLPGPRTPGAPPQQPPRAAAPAPPQPAAPAPAPAAGAAPAAGSAAAGTRGREPAAAKRTPARSAKPAD